MKKRVCYCLTFSNTHSLFLKSYRGIRCIPFIFQTHLKSVPSFFFFFLTFAFSEMAADVTPRPGFVWKQLRPPRSVNPGGVTDKPVAINSQACCSKAILDLRFPRAELWILHGNLLTPWNSIKNAFGHWSPDEPRLIVTQRAALLCFFFLGSARVHSPSHTILMYWSLHPLMDPCELLNILSAFLHPSIYVTHSRFSPS